MPRVSIIVPNYNHAPYLRQRLDSIFRQTFEDFEVILLDDCSTDNSREILAEYRSHPKVSHFVMNEVNSGSTFKQWQKGIQLAKGEFVWIAESDDWCEPTLLEALVAPTANNDQLAICYCGSIVFSENEVLFQSYSDKLIKEINGQSFVSKHLLRGNGIFNASAVIFKKKSFHSVSQKYLDLKLCGDWIFWIEIALTGEVHINARILNYFRKHKADVSGNAFQNGVNYREYLVVLDTLMEKSIITPKDRDYLIVEMINKIKGDAKLPADLKKIILKEFSEEIDTFRQLQIRLTTALSIITKRRL